ncbi:hypothetical protein Taro_008231 [Colocasia esculenta]|uniref:RING-type E3 ubiquitin transferase n=1 Tax=Colocasia esculenta TaxID=4460 RepID=A0A843TX14_COLES|nr:hypothetical protein [Colocasia esculenta]
MSYPPPPPPPPPSSSSDTSFPILTISILGMFTTAVLLVGYYVFVVKCCINWRRSDVISRLSDSREADTVATTSAGKRGLEEAVIRAIPIFRFRKGNGGGGGGRYGAKAGAFHECAICLNEFVDGERLRRLPCCSHAFHIDCIDVWLQSSANCPLCRSNVTGDAVLQTSQALGLVPQHHTGFLVMELRDDGSDGAGDDVTPRAEPLRQHQQQQSPRSPASQRQLSPTKAEQRTAQNKERGRFHHVGSMGDECIDVGRGEDEEFFSVQPMRRSFSVDSSCSRQLYLSVQEMILQQRDPRLCPHEVVGAGEGGSGSSVVLAAGRVVRRSFFSFGRSPRGAAAVLPMAMEP